MKKLGVALMWILWGIALGVMMLVLMLLFERPLYGDARDVYEKHKRSVVLVVSFKPASEEFTAGGGVVVTPNSVITMNHIVPEGWTVKTIFFGEQHAQEVYVGQRDQENDLARLSLNGNIPTGLMHPMELDISSPDVGQTLYVIGHPAAALWSLSIGYAMFPHERELHLNNAKPRKILQVSATASEGSSGGAVIDEHGKLRGLASMLQTDRSVMFVTPARFACKLIKCKEKK